MSTTSTAGTQWFTGEWAAAHAPPTFVQKAGFYWTGLRNNNRHKMHLLLLRDAVEQLKTQTTALAIDSYDGKVDETFYTGAKDWLKMTDELIDEHHKFLWLARCPFGLWIKQSYLENRTAVIELINAKKSSID